MADESWHVSDSDTEEKGTSFELSQKSDQNCVISLALEKVFGDNVNSTKMIELLQRISFSKSLELECADSYLEERKQARKRRKRKKRDSFPDGEISETTSERISTHTPSTSGECKDTRRPTLSAFDYEHEEFPALRGRLPMRKSTHPSRRKVTVGAAAVPILASIEAQLRNEEQLVEMSEDENHQESIMTPVNSSAPLVTPDPKDEEKEMNDGGGGGITTNGVVSGAVPSMTNGGKTHGIPLTNGHTVMPMAAEQKIFDFSFDEDDDDIDDSCESDVSIFSKIKHIENFLEQDN